MIFIILLILLVLAIPAAIFYAIAFSESEPVRGPEYNAKEKKEKRKSKKK